MTLPRQSLFVSAGLAAALLATLLLSWPALSGPFLFDDFPNLAKLKTLGDEVTWRSIGDYLVAAGFVFPGRPLAMLSFLLNDVSWPSDPRSFKYTNLMLHLLTGVMLFGLGRSLARMHADDARADWVALAATAAWLLHPLQLSASMLVVQRMALLSAMFTVAGLWWYAARARQATTNAQALWAIVGLGAFTLLAWASKETGALAPLLALVINVTLLRPALDTKPAAVATILRWGCRLPVAALLVAIAVTATTLISFSQRNFTLWERLMTQGRVVMDYVSSILLPRMGGGGLYHDDYLVSRGLLDPPTTLLCLVGILLALGLAIAKRRSWPVFSFAVLWYAAGHAMESTIFPLELYFEHRNYLPLFGLVFALAIAALRVPERLQLIAPVLFGLWLGLATFVSHGQARIWGDADLLAVVWARENPDSPRAVQQYAQYLQGTGRNPEAITWMADAYLRGVASDDLPLQALQAACYEPGPERFRGLLPLATQSAGEGGLSAATLSTMSKLRVAAQNQRCPDLFGEQDWWQLSELLLANPAYSPKGALRSYLHVERAYFLTARRDFGGTMAEFEQAYEGAPSIELSQLMAATLASAGLEEQGIEWLNRGLALRQKTTQRLWSSKPDTSRRMITALERRIAERGR